MCVALCANHEFLKPVLCVPVGELSMLLIRSRSARMTTMGNSWSATIPGVSAVERRRNLGRTHYYAPLGDAGRRFRPVVISAGGNELRYLSPLSTSIRVLLPSLTACILPSPNNS
jgi:hypothetical protein